jgi:hypothetical protein
MFNKITTQAQSVGEQIGTVKRLTDQLLVKVDDRLDGVHANCERTLAFHLCHVSRVVEKKAEMAIHDFDERHIEDFQTLVSNCGKRAQGIIAVDASDVRQWWINSMIGYLAIQASLGLKSVKRVFVWPRDQIGAEEGRKFLILHTLLGFETYVTTLEVYREWLGRSGDAATLTQEFLVYTGDLNTTTLQASPVTFG